MPIFDYFAVDKPNLESQYNWGYDQPIIMYLRAPILLTSMMVTTGSKSLKK